MYFNSYGEKDLARKLFRNIPLTVRKKLPGFDYGPAELKCPQGMKISKLMKQADKMLS
jgi:hypothetical protein